MAREALFGDSSFEIELFREPEADSDDTAGSSAEQTHAAASEKKPAAAKAVRVLAVGGAKGGVGKSTLAANLSLYLATIGRRVVAVDTDPAGANLHTCLGVDPVPSIDWRKHSGEQGKDAPLAEEALASTPFRGLQILRAGIDEPAISTAQARRRSRVLGRLQELDADYAVVDLGDGVGSPVLDAYLAADVAVFVTVPEPTAIENTHQFLRGAFVRHVVKQLSDRESRRELRRRLRELGRAPAPLDLLRSLEMERHPLADVVQDSLERFQPYIVINQTRTRADLELGSALTSVTRRRFGLRIHYLGHIDSDDTVWSCLRSRRPLLLESPGTKSSKKIEKIARRLLSIDAGKLPRHTVPNVPRDSHHDLLEVERGATDEEIRRAYKRCKEIYAAESLACYGLASRDELERLRSRLDEATDVLLDPARRRPYELSIFPPAPEPKRRDPEAELMTEPPPAPPEITPDTVFTGPLLKAVRESKRITLREISDRTKIGTSYLHAVEADRFGALPAVVYLRGFVTEMAKCLDLDAAQVSRTYVRRYQRYLDERGKL